VAIDPEVVRRLEQQASLIRQLQGALGGLEVRSFSVVGTTGAILAESPNADVSVSRTAAGRYTATWTRAWPSTDYVVVGSCFAGGSGIGIWSLDGAVSYTASAFGCMTINDTAFADLTWMCVAIGPLA
jgi:hypothetical protein